jgi:S-methylmethionine-dependent homocysteine/selenocysteine methylase
MTSYRSALPQLDGDPYLTDGGLETTLVFHDGIDLPHFAAFPLLRTGVGRAALRKYFRSYTAIAKRFDAGLILESPTWRANSDWAALLGYDRLDLVQANRAAIAMLAELRDTLAHSQPVVISGCLGPRGDGYVPSAAMTIREAAAYHREQIETFAAADADMVCAMTINYAAEAIGIVQAACDAAMPVAVSFTVETDGVLPTGQPLRDAIYQVDDATGGYPSYYMINCAHPTHLAPAFSRGGAWLDRIRGLRANASTKSHAELNESTELDIGDPSALGWLYADLRWTDLPRLNILGGCCGTDHRHVEKIAECCVPMMRSAVEVA